MTQAPDADAVITAFSDIPALLEATPALVARGRFLDCDCRLGPIDQPVIDPRRPHRRVHGATCSDAVLAIFLSRDACGLDRILEANAATRLARSARADQARRGGAG